MLEKLRSPVPPHKTDRLNYIPRPRWIGKGAGPRFGVQVPSLLWPMQNQVAHAAGASLQHFADGSEKTQDGEASYVARRAVFAEIAKCFGGLALSDHHALQLIVPPPALELVRSVLADTARDVAQASQDVAQTARSLSRRALARRPLERTEFSWRVIPGTSRTGDAWIVEATVRWEPTSEPVTCVCRVPQSWGRPILHGGAY
jgi:hypothetical protein